MYSYAFEFLFLRSAATLNYVSVAKPKRISGANSGCRGNTENPKSREETTVLVKKFKYFNEIRLYFNDFFEIIADAK